MKIFVMTLKGIRFEIEVKPEDTVADVKKNIETVQGGVYPAARQMLFHQGAVLKDGTTLEENKVAENGFVIVMLTRPQRSNVPVVTTQSSDAQAPAPPQSAAATIRPGSEPVGVPIPSVTAGNEPTTTSPAQPPEATPPSTVLPSGGPNAIPLNLFPQDVPNLFNPVGGRQSLDFVRNIPQFQQLRARVQENPQIMLATIQGLLQEMGRQIPQLARGIQEYQGEYLRLLSEPQEGGDRNEIPNQLVGGGALPQELTPEEQEAVGRLEAMGFDRALVLKAFIACNKDVELTANYLIISHCL